MEALEARVAPATFIVANTNDTGAGSLRQAVLDSNAHATKDTIAFKIGSGARTILNLAPMVAHPARLLRLVDVAVLNEIELAQATGLKLSPASSESAIVAACAKLRERGAGAVIATLGSRGVVVVIAQSATSLPACRAKVVDTTGAGDCFVGTLAARLAIEADIAKARTRDSTMMSFSRPSHASTVSISRSSPAKRSVLLGRPGAASRRPRV